MTTWRWLSLASVLAVHDQQIGRHGGLPGIRDKALIESALARPQNLAAYGEPDAAELAASYAFGIARNHPFVDGNIRTAFVTAALFLDKNDYILAFDEADVVLTILRLAAGEMSEDALAMWFCKNIQTGLHDEAVLYKPARRKKKAKSKPKREPKKKLVAKPQKKRKAKA